MDVALFFGADSHDTIKWSLAFVIAQMRTDSAQESGALSAEKT